MTKTKCNVEGMTCTNCKKVITKGLLSIDGVSKASISLSQKEVNVVYDPTKITEAEIFQQITNQGYEVIA